MAITVKMTVKDGDKEFVFEGERAVILGIYREITGIPHVKPTREASQPSPTQRTLSQKPLAKDALLEYITSRPRFSHDIVEIQKHFFGRRIPSRENPRQYRKLATQLHNVRRLIEEREQGKFKEILAPTKNLKKYVFRSTKQEK